MPHLADRITRLSESATLKMAALARELKAEGKDIISLSLGEPDFDTPVHIQEAAKAAVVSEYFHYPPVNGLQELREAVCEKFKRDNGLQYEPNQVVVSTGAKQTLMNVVMCTINPGDEVIVPAPYWVSYAAMVALSGGKMVNISAGVEQDFKITPEQLEAAITETTRLFIFSSPSNPTGSIYTKEELQGLAEVFERYPDITIVSDEIYEHINFVGNHESIAQFDSIYDRTVTVNGMSKGFAMTGWRVGFMGAPLQLAKACNKMQGQFTSGACAISQKAAVAGLRGDMSPTLAMRDTFKQRRDMLLGLLEEIPGLKMSIPTGAFYVFPDVSSYFGKQHGDKTIANADDLSMYILQEANVSVVTGSAFGSDNCIRISYAASEAQLREAVQRIATVLSQLR